MIGIALVSIIVIYAVNPLFFDVKVKEKMPPASVSIPMGNFIGIGDGIHNAVGDVFVVESEDGQNF